MATTIEEYNELTGAFTALAEAAEQGMEQIRREARASLVKQALEDFERLENSESLKIQ